MQVTIKKQAPPHPEHLPFLDGVRGYAALYVLILHCMIWGGWWPRRLPDPKIAVDVFMVMSGYLMVYHWRSKEYGRNFDLRTACIFWIKRFFRIAPLYYLLLSLIFLLGPIYTEGFRVLESLNPFHRLARLFDPSAIAAGLTPGNFLLHLSFLFGLFPQYATSTLTPDWSISLEMQFYAVFPALLILFRRFGYSAVAVLAVVFCVVARHVWPVSVDPSFLLLKLPIFLIGMVVAEANRVFKENKSSGTSLLILALVLAATAVSIGPVLVVLASLLFLLVSATGPQPLRPFTTAAEWLLGNRLARALADLSYCVYLLHPFFLSFAGGRILYRTPAFLALPPALRMGIFVPVVMVCSYATAYVLHKIVEKPGIRLGSRLAFSLRTQEPNTASSNAAPRLPALG
jgi:peptidoglycan/LPS O-acetylase OafA/YrhL